jgi:hypothetical protein
MNKHLKIFLLLAVIVFAHTQEVDEAPSTCALTEAAQARVTASPCFAELEPIISCLPPSEQDLWAKANEDNTNETLCFKCNSVKSGLKDAVKKNIKSHSDKLSKKGVEKRKGIGCFKDLEEDLDEEQKKELTSNLQLVVYNQLEEGRCQAALLRDVGNILIQRKRMFCAPNADRDKMVFTETDSKVEQLKFNLDEATNMVDHFLNFFECQANQVSTYANGISTMVNVISKSSKCKKDDATDGDVDNNGQDSENPDDNQENQGDGEKPIDGGNGDKNPPSPPTKIVNDHKSSRRVLNSPRWLQDGNENSDQSGESEENIPEDPLITPLPTGEFDYTSYISEFSDLSSTYDDEKFTSLDEKVKASFNGEAEIKCNPPALMKLLSGISTEQKEVRQAIKSIETSCDTPFFYVIENGNVDCVGCSEFSAFELKFKDEKRVPENYYIAFGCATNKHFVYSEIPDLKYPDVVFKSFIFQGTDSMVDSNQNCLGKAEECVPGKSDQKCGKLKDDCQKKLDEKCAATKLTDFVVSTTATYPTDCDYVSKGVEMDDKEFVIACTLYISETFLKGTVIINPEALVNASKIVAEAAQAQPTEELRMLQNSDFVVEVDPTIEYNTFSDVVLTSADVVVDRSTADTTATLDVALNDLTDDTTEDPIDNTDPDSQSFIKLAFSLAMLVLLL